MSYIQKTLLADETLSFTTRKHWIIFFLPTFFTLLGIAFLFQKDVLILIGYLSLLLGLYFWITAFTTYMTSEYAVTNKRVLIKIGFIQRQSWETLLPKVASFEVNQSILGRMLGYGTLIIQSTGGGKDAFTVISNPLVFRRKVQEQAEKMQVNLSVNQPSSPSQSDAAPNTQDKDAGSPQPRERL